MHNFVKLFFVTLISFFIFSFTKNENKPTKTNTVTVADTLTWRLLGEIKYQKKKHATYGEVEFPIVNNKLKKLGGKEVVISGFIVPIDNKNYAISKNVFASCFFCGKAGPETIMGIKFKGALPKIKTDTYMTLKGKFKYNETDVEDWIYNITDAVTVSKN